MIVARRAAVTSKKLMTDYKLGIRAPQKAGEKRAVLRCWLIGLG
jgi:hypothetical protein